MSNQIATTATSTPALLQGIMTDVELQTGAGALMLPPNYSAANALRAAWYIILDTQDKNKKPVLETCTEASVKDALQRMVLEGMNPAKKQCYFIAYGNKLTYQRSYMGTLALVKRYAKNFQFANAQVVYEGDIFEFTIDPMTGAKVITKHSQTLASMNSKIVAAYAIISADNRNYVDILTIEQIIKAWKQRPGGEVGDTHKQFAEEMCKKTALTRCAKLIINSSDDASLFEEDEELTPENKLKIVNAEIEEKTAVTPIGFDTAEAEEIVIDDVDAYNDWVKEQTEAMQQAEPVETVQPEEPVAVESPKKKATKSNTEIQF